MNTEIGFIFLMLLLLLLAGVFVMVKAPNRSKRLKGVKLLQALRMLVRHLQIHRGKSACYLSHHQEEDIDLKEELHAISIDFENIVKIAEELTENENWYGITQHWARLSIKSGAVERLDNYDQHCRIIAACIELMRNLSQVYNVNQYCGVDSEIYWYELLLLSEKLGQLRALGLIYLSESKNIQVKSVCLSWIKKRISEINGYGNESLLKNKLGTKNFIVISEFLAMIQHHIIDQQGFISCDRYFAHASETIDMLYENFDAEMYALRLYCSK